MSEGARVGKDSRLQASDSQTRSYTKLLRKFIIVSVTCSVLPLMVVGWISYLYYFQSSLSRRVDDYQREVDYNRKIVQTFLQERTSDVKLLAFTHSLGFLTDSSNIREAFNLLNQDGYYFTDLGVIDEKGKHMAYVGPYDLWDNDYSVTFWFKEVMERGVCVSDMFMGYRKIPHFVIAILRSKEKRPWILRATIDNEFLGSLIEKKRLGRTGEVFLVNREGFYQTAPRFDGKLMDKAALPVNSFTDEGGIGIIDPSLPRDSWAPLKTIPLTDLIKYSFMHSHSQQVVGYSWLKDPEWLLVVRQDFSEIFGDITRVNTAILVLLHSSILAILIISVFTARHMVNAIRHRDQEAERLNKQLTQTSKLASIGELAAGVAHEINNPLAVIFTENQVIRDLTEDEENLDRQFKDELVQSLSRVDAQVERCSHITQNLLRFSQCMAETSQLVDLNRALKNVVGLLEKRANTVGVQISLDCQVNLPPFRADPFELEQVFLNLINNSIDAHDGRPYGSIQIATRLDSTGKCLVATVADTGSGIPGEVRERLFDPFFTTKPVGKGTGLGLSISYSIVRKMGGDISVRSEVGKGTVFTVLFPCPTAEPNNISEDTERTT